jgi:transposase
MPRRTNAAPVTIGIDPGKNTFHLIGLDARGGMARDRVAARLSNMAPCLIGIEAGMGTHYVTRELLAIGHDVRQVPPVYAKPFRQTHKNDFRDAHATAEAVQRPRSPGTTPRALPLGWPAHCGHQSDS